MSISARARRGALLPRTAAVLASLALSLAALPLAAAAEPGAGGDAGRMPVPDKSRHATFAWQAEAETVPGALIVTSASEAAARRLEAGRWAAAVDGAADGAAAALARGRVASLGGRSTLVRVAPGAEDAAAATLRALPGVTAVERDRVNTWAAVPEDPRFGEQWAHVQTNIVPAWDTTTGVASVRIAVLDSGMLGTHEDLQPNIVSQWNFALGTPVGPLTPPQDNDPCGIGHGTQVGGVVGARGDNGIGIAGVNWRVSLIDISLSSPAQGCGGPTDSAVIAALNHLATDAMQPVHAVNMSFGAPAGACPVGLHNALQGLRARGTTIVAAAGNTAGVDGVEILVSEVPQTPAACAGVISVGATGPSGGRAFYSSMGLWVDVAAPGGSTAEGGDSSALVLTTCRGGTADYCAVQGTSFAAPYVAGLVGLLQAATPHLLTPDQVESLLQRNAAGGGLHTIHAGYGIVNAASSMTGAVVTPPEAIPPPLARSELPPADTPVPLALRVSSRTGTTTAVEQAVQVSRAMFPPGGAAHAVLARSDDYADALAGSSLGYGVAPLLFTPPTGPLAGPTRTELQRALAPGGRVYLLGGTAALPAGLEAELQAMGYQPMRLAGAARELTAAVVARETRRRIAELGDESPPRVIVATRQNWPDAVAAGSLGAAFGIPILLTPRDALHSATRDALAEFRPQQVYVIGGNSAVDQTVADAAGQVAGGALVTRLGGGARDGTAVAVGVEIERILADFGLVPAVGIAVNLRRGDGYAHVLSASVFAGGILQPDAGVAFGVFLPLESSDGRTLTVDGRAYACGLGADVIVQGDRDLIVESAVRELQTAAGQQVC
jgi:putative cell wall-binding protein